MPSIFSQTFNAYTAMLTLLSETVVRFCGVCLCTHPENVGFLIISNTCIYIDMIKMAISNIEIYVRYEYERQIYKKVPRMSIS